MSRAIAQKSNNVYLELLISVICVLLLFLTSVNIYQYLKPAKVLGASVKEGPTENEFWHTFMTDNPEYIPGWIQLGRFDKVREIDPNYFSGK